MWPVLCALLVFLRTLFRSRLSREVQVLALRHQLAVHQRSIRRPHIRAADRIIWSWISRRWSRWREVLAFVKPATVLAWRRKRFRDHWARIGHSRMRGRPAPKYLLRDRDAIYGGFFQRRIQSMGIEQVLSAPRSPWQNPYVERLIGTLRRDCLDHLLVLNERHLKRVLTLYFDYYHRWGTHLSLVMDTPGGRTTQPPNLGRVIGFPEVGGLHHHYERLAA